MRASNICVFPIKQHSERVPGKNLLKIPDGRKLYQTVTKAAVESCAFDKVVIDTDSDEIRDWALENDIDFLPREPYLAKDTANGNSLIRHHVEMYPKYDFYWQGFVTVPYISSNTISTMVAELMWSDGKYDSLITVEAIKGFLWLSNGQPISYRPDVLPRSQDLPRVYAERSGFFAISRKSFLSVTRCRYGAKPLFFELPRHESAEIDWPQDIVNIQRKTLPQP